MKKIALLLALLMIAGAFAACGGSSDSKDPVNNPNTIVSDPEPNGNTPVTPPVESEPVSTPDSNTTPDPGPDIEDDGKFLTEDPEEFAKEFTGYETITVDNAALVKGELVLVGTEHSFDAANATQIVRVKDYNLNGFSSVMTSATKLNYVALRKLQELNCDMQKAQSVTYLLCIQAGYLTNDELANLHENYPDEYPEEADKSDLHTGNAAVLSVFTGAMNYGFRNSAVTKLAQWVEENAAKYGFIQGDDIGENAKLRYVGVPHATYMKANGLDLEGYLSQLKNGEKLQITDHRDLTWTVYYVSAAEGASTEIEVPTGMSYSISGDNNGGFIVTVKGICQ